MTGYTKIPNEMLDKMSELSGAEFKLAMALCRLTYGYQRKGVRASLSQLGDITGLSRQGILNASANITHLFEREMDGGVTIWLVKSVDQYPQSNELTGSQLSRPDWSTELTDTGQLSRPPSIKEKKENTKIKWDDVLSMLDYFTEVSHIKQPMLGDDGWKPHQEKWIDPIMNLLEVNDYDCQVTRQKISGAVKLMREKELIIATPKSIYNVALSVNGSTSEKVGRPKGGGLYV